MKVILIGTKNQGKIEGAKRAFEQYFDAIKIQGIAVETGVNAQPVNQEIYRGAKNRIENLKKQAKENQIEADFYIAIESGLNNFIGEWLNTNVAIIEDKNGYTSCGTRTFFSYSR